MYNQIIIKITSSSLNIFVYNNITLDTVLCLNIYKKFIW